MSKKAALHSLGIATARIRNGTPHRLPLNYGCRLGPQTIGTHSGYGFTCQDAPWTWPSDRNNAGIEDLRFHDLRHTGCLGALRLQRVEGACEWKSRSMMEQYAKYATEHLAAAASRIEDGRGGNVVLFSTSPSRQEMEKA